MNCVRELFRNLTIFFFNNAAYSYIRINAFICDVSNRKFATVIFAHIERQQHKRWTSIAKA